MKEPLWAAEVSLAALFAKQPRSFLFVPVAKFPGISRDVSFLAERNVSYQAIKDAVEGLSIPYLKEFSLVDLFRGGSIPEDKVSLLVRFLYVNPQRTLLAEEVSSFEQKIIETLRAKLNIQLREGGEIDK
jgi:phenylalanyl-tRNA synthetase beta chain